MDEKTGDRGRGTGDGAPSRPGKTGNGTAGQAVEPRAFVTVPEVMAAKGVRRLVMVTATDEPSSRLADAAGVDLVLVGDSLAMAALGRADTLSVTMDEMVHHTRAAAAGARRALLIADMPFGSYQASVADAVRNACRLVGEGGARAVKLEGHRPGEVSAIRAAGVPVVAHLGLTPQSVHAFGGYRVQGREAEQALVLLGQARELEAAGAFLLVLEAIPPALGRAITHAVGIPTIGIGAGPACDGQVLVAADLLGLSAGPLPRFVRRYAELDTVIRAAVEAFAADVRAGAYPADEECYPDPPGLEAVVARCLAEG